jgi:xanthine dehydrogenase YagT iron-sulfur-binding subunit
VLSRRYRARDGHRRTAPPLTAGAGAPRFPFVHFRALYLSYEAKWQRVRHRVCESISSPELPDPCEIRIMNNCDAEDHVHGEEPSSAADLSRREFLHHAAAGGMIVAGAASGGAKPAAARPSQAELVTVKLRINTRDYELKVDPRVSLLDALREYLGLTGTKKGCDHGQCGACTVLVGGTRIYSCLSFAVMHEGDAITTIEGLADGDRLHPLQEAFIKHDAFQCGYCTSGQICSAHGLLTEKHAHTDAEIREQMSGNICRCGAYPNILAAIKEAQTTLASNP